MRPIIALLMSASLALLAAAPAYAQLHLAWDDCGAAGTVLKTSACDQNLAYNRPEVPRLYASYLAPAGTSKVVGMEAYVQFAVAGSTLPAWWRLDTGGCRSTSLHVQFNTTCASAIDYWGSVPGGPYSAASYDPDYLHLNPSTALLRLVVAVDSRYATALQAGAEYYAFTLVVNQLKTVGTDACAGCALPAAIAFSGLKLTQPYGVGDIRLLPPGPPPTVWWQCPSVVTGFTPVSLVGAGSGNDLVWGDFSFDCATPTQPKTWGQVKSLYR